MSEDNKNIEAEINPLGDRVLCKRIEDKEEKIADGIIIPEAAIKENQEAIVVAVGPGTMLQDGSMIPLSVVPGMKILLPKYGGTEREINDVKYQIVHEREIIAVIGKV